MKTFTIKNIFLPNLISIKFKGSNSKSLFATTWVQIRNLNKFGLYQFDPENWLPSARSYSHNQIIPPPKTNHFAGFAVLRLLYRPNVLLNAAAEDYIIVTF